MFSSSGEVRNVTVKRDNDGCLYIVICCDVPEMRLEREGTGSIGIDFGMKTFLTMSDGESVQIPDYHMRSLETTRMADRSYSKKLNAKVYGSSFKRAKKVRQKAHRKVADRRSDFHWKFAHELCRKNTFIAIEDLNLEGMKRHKRWGRKISSLGFGEFVRKLYVVADKYGTTVHKIGRFAASSQTCSECGHVNKGTKGLNVREWVCPVCGAVHDRDVNAARNILAFAQEEIKGEGVPLIGSGNETGGGSPPAQPCLEVSLHEPSENPMTSVVGVRQNVFSSDLVDRGYGHTGMNFLETMYLPFGTLEDVGIITNLPYKIHSEFIEHALEILPEGAPCIMLLKTTALEGKKRFEKLYKNGYLKAVYQFVERLLCAKNARFDDMIAGGGSAVSYAWYWFEKGNTSDTIIKRI